VNGHVRLLLIDLAIFYPRYILVKAISRENMFIQCVKNV